MENKIFIPEIVEGIQDPFAEKLNYIEGVNEEMRTLESKETSNNTYNLHLMLQDTQPERTTTMSQEQMDIAWTSLEP
jgi:hypothetical protein